MTITYFDIEQRSKEWFDLRKKYNITASKAGNFLGLSKYITADEAIDNARFDIEEKVNEYHTNRGVTLEDDAIESLEIEINKSVSRCGIYVYDDWLAGSPDGLTDDEVIEVKCPMVLPSEPDQCHAVQCKVNMFLTDKSGAYLYYYTDKCTKLFYIVRNFEIEETIEILKKINDIINKEPSEAERELITLIDRYKMAKNTIDGLQSVADELKKSIDDKTIGISKMHIAGHCIHRIERSGGYDYKKYFIDNNVKISDDYRKPSITYLTIK